MDELKPCPFCGGEAEITAVTKGLVVVCNVCGASSKKIVCKTINNYKRKDIPIDVRFKFAFDDAISAWNRRADNG